MNSILAGVLVLLVAACSATGGAAGPAQERDRYVFVWLVTGPTTELADDARAAAFEGHFANMARLAEEGSLLLAGPYGQEKARPDLRGILLFDVPDVETARALTNTDPAVAAGIFDLELAPLETDAPLRSLPRLEQRNTPGLEGMRHYVLATAPDADEALAALDDALAAGLVLMAGRLGGERAGEGLYLLEADTVADARALLRDLDADAVEWSLSRWFGTRMVAELR